MSWHVACQACLLQWCVGQCPTSKHQARHAPSPYSFRITHCHTLYETPMPARQFFRRPVARLAFAPARLGGCGGCTSTPRVHSPALRWGFGSHLAPWSALALWLFGSSASMPPACLQASLGHTESMKAAWQTVVALKDSCFMPHSRGACCLAMVVVWEKRHGTVPLCFCVGACVLVCVQPLRPFHDGLYPQPSLSCISCKL